MLGCLRELDAALRERGARLFVRRGRPEDELPRLAREVGATSVHLTADVSPWARARDARVTEALRGLGVDVHAAPGGAVVDDPAAIRTQQDRPYTVFSPFARAWLRAGRRAPVRPPAELRAPARPAAGDLPGLEELGLDPSDALARPRRRARRGRRAPAARELPALRPGDVRRPARPAGGRLVAPVPLPALGLRLPARARPPRRRAGGRRRAGLPHRAGLARLLRGGARALPARDPARVPGALPRPRVGAPGRRSSRRGSRAAPGSRWSTPACASSWPRAGCTTASAWSSARS